MVVGMENYEQFFRETALKGESYVFEDFKREKCSINGLNHQRLRTAFGIDALNHTVGSVDQSSVNGEVRQNVFGVIQKDRKGVYLDRVSEPRILRPEPSPVSALNQNKPVLVTSEARTESEEKALELYRTHLHEFMTTSHPEPDFRVYGVGDRFYASLDETQKLYILNKFVAGAFRLTADKELENKFTDHFRHNYYFEENAEKVRRLAGYKTASLNKQG